MRNFILVALLAIGLSCISTNANAQCANGVCRRPVASAAKAVVEAAPVRRLAALPAKAIPHTAQAVAERRPVRRLLKAVVRAALAPAKAVRRARCR